MQEHLSEDQVMYEYKFLFHYLESILISNYGKPLFDRITDKNGSQEAGTVTSFPDTNMYKNIYKNIRKYSFKLGVR